MSNYI